MTGQTDRGRQIQDRPVPLSEAPFGSHSVNQVPEIAVIRGGFVVGEAEVPAVDACYDAIDHALPASEGDGKGGRRGVPAHSGQLEKSFERPRQASEFDDL